MNPFTRMLTPRRLLTAAALMTSLGVAALHADDKKTAASLSDSDLSFVKDAARSNYKEVALSELAQKNASNPEVRDYARKIIKDHRKASDQLQKVADEHGVDLKIAGKGTMKDPASPQAAARTADRRTGAEAARPTASVPAPQDQRYGAFSGMAPVGFDDDADDGITLEQYRELAEASGAEFDERYIELMAASHERAVERFEEAQEDVENADLRSYASKHLPTLRQHLQQVENLQSSVAE